MNAYIYQAALYCERCGNEIRERLTAEGKAPANPDDEITYDSDDFPKGPYPDGGGEADCPQHCDSCNCHLENPATADGANHIRQSILDFLCSNDGDEDVIETWRAYYPECEPNNTEIASELLAVALNAARNNPHKSPAHWRWIKTCEQVRKEGI